MNGFLLDENVPKKLRFTPSGLVIRWDSLGMSPSDELLWNFARENRLAIVTKDADFSDRIMLSRPPPWVVHLRFGNLSRGDFHAMLEKVWPRIESLLPSQKLICVYVDRIESFAD